MPSRAERLFSTQARILRAAAEAFAQRGLEGATTREIARLAGVNEVTLFRHFQSKEKLLAAVVEKTLSESDRASESLREAVSDGSRTVEEVLRAHIATQHQLLSENMPLLRAFIGEIHRYCEHEKGVFKTLYMQNRAELIRDLRLRQEEGSVRPEVNLEIVADQFNGIVLSDLLRRTASTVKLNYPLEEFQAATVALFARGLETPVEPARSARRRVRS